MFARAPVDPKPAWTPGSAAPGAAESADFDLKESRPHGVSWAYHVFALTSGTGSKSFGAALATATGDGAWQCILFVTRWPFFRVFETALRHVVHLAPSVSEVAARGAGAGPVSQASPGTEGKTESMVCAEHLLWLLIHVDVPTSADHTVRFAVGHAGIKLPEGALADRSAWHLPCRAGDDLRDTEGVYVPPTLRVVRDDDPAALCGAGELLYELRAPPPDSLPLGDESCLQPLLAHFDTGSILSLVSCLLAEQSVLLHAQDLALLTPVCEALFALMFPFRWPHVYVPVLPAALLESLEAPVPFIIGIHSELVASVPGECLSRIVLVRVDTGSVVHPIAGAGTGGMSEHAVPPLPRTERLALARKLELACSSSSDRPWDYLLVRASFLDFYVSLIGRFFVRGAYGDGKGEGLVAVSTQTMRADWSEELAKEDPEHCLFFKHFFDTLVFQKLMEDALLGSRDGLETREREREVHIFLRAVQERRRSGRSCYASLAKDYANRHCLAGCYGARPWKGTLAMKDAADLVVLDRRMLSYNKYDTKGNSNNLDSPGPLGDIVNDDDGASDEDPDDSSSSSLAMSSD